MTISLRPLSALAIGALVLAGVLTGCATGAGGSPAPESTADPIVADAPTSPRAAWLDPTAFVVETWSDACGPQVADVITGEQSLDITLVEPEDAVCGQVQTAHGTYVGLPAGLDSSRPVELTITDAGGKKTQLSLPGLESGGMRPADQMPEQVPAAAWIGDEELAVLTWGSSTCVPGSGQVEAVDEHEGIVRLESTDDAICTMDLVPRITLVQAAGVKVDAVLTLADYVDADGEPVVLKAVR